MWICSCGVGWEQAEGKSGILGMAEPITTPQTGQSCSPVSVQIYSPNLKGATLMFFPPCRSQCKFGVCLIKFTDLYVLITCEPSNLYLDLLDIIVFPWKI